MRTRVYSAAREQRMIASDNVGGASIEREFLRIAREFAAESAKQFV
jgi:hypothetical protein